MLRYGLHLPGAPGPLRGLQGQDFHRDIEVVPALFSPPITLYSGVSWRLHDLGGNHHSDNY